MLLTNYFGNFVNYWRNSLLSRFSDECLFTTLTWLNAHDYSPDTDFLVSNYDTNIALTLCMYLITWSQTMHTAFFLLFHISYFSRHRFWFSHWSSSVSHCI